jgi:4-amino-4-deoxy-L-arabinose transferase-like glycosyltransferase
MVGLLMPLVAALVVLFYKLGTLPPVLSLDEFRFAYFSANLNGSPYLPYFVKFDSFNDNHPTFLMYQIMNAEKILGPTLLAARFVPALYGFLTVIVFYFLIKELLNKNYAFIGAFVLLFSYKFIAFSRWLTETSIYLFTLTFSLFFWLKFFKSVEKRETRKSLFYSALLGLAVGLAQNTYFSAQVFLPAFPLLLLGLGLKNKLPLKLLVFSFTLYALGFFVGAAPMVLAYFKAPPGSFNSRRLDLPLFRNDVSPADKFHLFVYGTKQTLKMFNFKGSEQLCYSYPGSKFLDPLSGLLFLIGLFYSFLKLNKWLAASFFGLFLVALFPSFLSHPGAVPQEVRAAGAIIFTSLYVTLSLKAFASLVRNAVFRGLLVVLLLAALGILNLKSYFFDQMQTTSLCQGAYEAREVRETITKELTSKKQHFLIYPVFK